MKQTVLIVDDSPTIRRLSRVFLSGLDIEIREATNGREALAAVSVGGVDLVMTDLDMPELDGLGFLQEVRAHDDPAIAGIPVVVLTMNQCPVKRAAVLDAGASEFLVKPVSIPQMREVVSRLLLLPATS